MGPAAADWRLLAWLGPMIVVAAAIAVPAQMRAVVAARGGAVPGRRSAAPASLGLAAVALVAAAVGTAAAARVGLEAPVLRTGFGADVLGTLARHVGQGAAVGLLVAGVALPLYYGAVRPRFEPEAFRLVERIRRGMGLTARVAMGGVIEEVIFRWGVLAGLAWIGLRVTGGVGPAVRWSSIVGAAFLFGLAHLPGARGLGIRPGPAVLLLGLTINGLLGIAAGWMVWERGLVAAMSVHATVHVAWSAVEASRSA